jgi:SAM-dependent methyltransferase
MKKELLIGCGSNRDKRMRLLNDANPGWDNLTTLDNNPAHKPDIEWDLNRISLPFDDDAFDEIHAYEVLEHTGAQGDYMFFFRQFSTFYRVLKPGGHLLATVPSRHSVWAWGDPSHTRIIQPESLVFLQQPMYTKGVGVTPMSDFRYIYKSDFDVVHCVDDGETFSFVLKAIKPSRITG